MNAWYLIRIVVVWALLLLVTAARSGFGWNTGLSCALIVAVLTLVIHAISDAASWSLLWAVFLLDFGIAWCNTLDEAVLFHVVSPSLAVGALVYGAIVSFALSAALVFAMNRFRAQDVTSHFGTSPLIRGWAWKLLAGAAYVALYFIAGICVHPFIAVFYAHRWLPSASQLAAIQYFRGMLYIAVALPFLRHVAAVGRLQAGVLLGVCYATLGGIAPLLMPNPYMPAHIRFAHSVEVGLSNFAFGLDRRLTARCAPDTRRSQYASLRRGECLKQPRC